MPAGRPRKPAELKVLQGTARPDRENATEPKPVIGASDCPAWLDATARGEWQRMAPALERLRILTEIDTAALAAYCQAYADHQWAAKRLQKLGKVYQTKTGFYRPRPEVAMQRDAAVRMKAFLVEFGLTPASRSRVHAQEPEQRDPFADFLARGKRDGSAGAAVH